MVDLLERGADSTSRDSDAESTASDEQTRRATPDGGWLPPAASTSDVRPGDIEARADIVQHTGLTPEEFVVALLEHHDGNVPQQAFAENTGLSASALSRLLTELEGDGLVCRVQFGCRKVVYLPGTDPRAGSEDASEPRTEATGPTSPA